MTTVAAGASYAFKIIIVGDSNVGKTSIVHRFLYDERPTNVHLTVGVDFGIRLVAIGDVRVKLQIWDTAGQEMYRSIASAYYRNAAGCVAMFDLTNQRSFASLQRWVGDIYQAAPNVRCIVVGNKADLTDKKVVCPDVARMFATSVNAEYTETSMLDGKSVQRMFQRLATRIYNEQVKTPSATPHADGITILSTPPPTLQGKRRTSCQCKQ